MVCIINSILLTPQRSGCFPINILETPHVQKTEALWIDTWGAWEIQGFHSSSIQQSQFQFSIFDRLGLFARIISCDETIVQVGLYGSPKRDRQFLGPVSYEQKYDFRKCLNVQHMIIFKTTLQYHYTRRVFRNSGVFFGGFY